MCATPPFDDALTDYRRFLGEQGFPTDMVWVWREDVTGCRRGWWIHLPVPGDNERRARDYYDWGRRAGLGVTLEALGRADGRSACFVWCPEDEKAASSAMQRPLKLLIPVVPEDGTPVRSRLGWAARCWWNRRKGCDLLTFVTSRRQVAGVLDGNRRK